MITAILQARMSSSRLPGKVLKPILGRPMLALQIERVRCAKKIDHLILATSTEPSDQPLVQLARELGVACFQGSLDDVLGRFYKAVSENPPDHVVRLTGDNPLSDPGVIDEVINFHLRGGFDYSSNAIKPTFPDGLDVEVFKWQPFEESYREAVLPSEREHVTPFIYRRPTRYEIGYFESDPNCAHLRWTVDEAKDFELVKKIYEALYPRNPNFSWKDVLVFIEQHPELATWNTEYQRNEGLQKSLLKDQKVEK